MFIRRPQTFELFRRELRGSLAGPNLYRRSQAEAIKLGDALPVMPRETARPRRAREWRDTATREIDAKANAPLDGLGGAEYVRVLVNAHGQRVGELTIEVHDGMVGIDRLRDVIAAAFPVELLGIDLNTARRTGLAIVRKGLANL
jgi:hypothetical protein